MNINLTEMLGLRMRFVTWNRFPIYKNCSIYSLVCQLCGEYLTNIITH